MIEKRNEQTDEERGAAEADAAAARAAADTAAAPDAADTATAPDAATADERDITRLSREELENELEVARAEIERLQDQSLRRQAELINYRRRVQRELAEAAQAGQGRLLELLLPVVDDFERAVESDVEDARAYHEGVQLILRSLHKALEQIGVERVEPVGETFDPTLHEAIARHETEEVPDGQIIEVYQPGYTLGDRLVRPASVVVAFGGGPAEAGATADNVSVVDDEPRDDG